MLLRLRNAADLRRRKVRRMRAMIRVGVYDNDLKLAIAVDRFVDGEARPEL